MPRPFPAPGQPASPTYAKGALNVADVLPLIGFSTFGVHVLGNGADLAKDVCEGDLVRMQRVGGVDETLEQQRVVRQALDGCDEQVCNVEAAPRLRLGVREKLAERGIADALAA